MYQCIRSRIPRPGRGCLTETNSSRSLEQNALSLMRKVMAAWWQDETFLGLGAGGCTRPNRLTSHFTCMYLLIYIYTYIQCNGRYIYIYLCIIFAFILQSDRDMFAGNIAVKQHKFPTRRMGLTVTLFTIEHAFCHCSFCSTHQHCKPAPNE